MQDWVFDCASSLSLDQFIKQSGNYREIQDFSHDVKTIDW